METPELSFPSFLNDVAKDMQKAALFLIAFAIGMDIVCWLNGIFAPFWPFLILFVPFYLAAKHFKASIHLTREQVLFKRHLWGMRFDKTRALNNAQYIDLKWVVRGSSGTGSGGGFTLDIAIVTTQLDPDTRILLDYDLHFTPEDKPADVVDVLYQLHRVTGLPLQFETLAAERFYDLYVSKYGQDSIKNPRLIA